MISNFSLKFGQNEHVRREIYCHESFAMQVWGVFYNYVSDGEESIPFSFFKTETSLFRLRKEERTKEVIRVQEYYARIILRAEELGRI